MNEMNNDRELLKLAAKAADIEIATWSNTQAGGFLSREMGAQLGGNFWNPLTDDGDALRLAVKLGLLVQLSLDPASELHCADVLITPNPQWIREPLNGGDPYSATRRAIVRAAAEIGKSL